MIDTFPIQNGLKEGDAEESGGIGLGWCCCSGWEHKYYKEKLTSTIRC